MTRKPRSTDGLRRKQRLEIPEPPCTPKPPRVPPPPRPAPPFDPAIPDFRKIFKPGKRKG